MWPVQCAALMMDIHQHQRPWHHFQQLTEIAHKWCLAQRLQLLRWIACRVRCPIDHFWDDYIPVSFCSSLANARSVHLPRGSECPVVDQSASNSQTGMFFNISFEENSLDPQQTITSALRETQSVFISNKCLNVYLYDLFIYLTFRYILHICIIL